MPRTWTEVVTLQETSCCVCGITFAVPKDWLEARHRSGKEFRCPNGDVLLYHETTEMQLRKELTAEQKRIQALELQLTSAQDQLEASKREMKRHQKRIANGVCPCCHRSFVQLQRHMKTQHPEYVKGK